MLRVPQSRKLFWGFAPARTCGGVHFVNCTESAAVLPAQVIGSRLELAIAKAKICDSPLAEFLSCWPTQSAHFCALRGEVYFFVWTEVFAIWPLRPWSRQQSAVCVSFYKHARQECLVFSVEPQHDNCYCTRSQRSPFSRRSDLGAPGALKNQFLLFRCAAHSILACDYEHFWLVNTSIGVRRAPYFDCLLWSRTKWTHPEILISFGT